MVFKVALFPEVQFGGGHFFVFSDTGGADRQLQSSEHRAGEDQFTAFTYERRSPSDQVCSCGFGRCCFFSNLMLLTCYHRTIVSELKEEVGRFSVRDCQPVLSKLFLFSSFHGVIQHLSHTLTLDLGASLFPQSLGREVRVEEAGPDSDDSSLTPSLAEVSSDDLTWLDDRDPGEDDRSLLSASTPRLT